MTSHAGVVWATAEGPRLPMWRLGGLSTGERRRGGCSALLAWTCRGQRITWLDSTIRALRAGAVHTEIQTDQPAQLTAPLDLVMKGSTVASSTAYGSPKHQLAEERELHNASQLELRHALAGEAAPSTSHPQPKPQAGKQRTERNHRRWSTRSSAAPDAPAVSQGEGLRTAATRAVGAPTENTAQDQHGEQLALKMHEGSTSNENILAAGPHLQHRSGRKPPEQDSIDGSTSGHAAGRQRRKGMQSPLRVAGASPTEEKNPAGGSSSNGLPIKTKRQGRAHEQRRNKHQQQAAERGGLVLMDASASFMLAQNSPQTAAATAVAATIAQQDGAALNGQGPATAQREPQGQLQRRQQGSDHPGRTPGQQAADKQKLLHMRRLAAHSRSTPTTAAGAAAAAEVGPAATVQPSQQQQGQQQRQGQPLQQPGEQLQLGRDRHPLAGQHVAAGSQTPAQPAQAPSSQPLPDLTHLATPAALRVLEELGLPTDRLAAALAAAAAAQRPASQRTLPLQEGEVRAAAAVLVDGLGLPVSKLPAVLLAAPEVLLLGEGELRQRVSALASLHRSMSALRRRLPQHPQMLGTPFISQLGPGLKTLVSLGLSRQQACQAVVGCPDIVHRRRYELAAAVNGLTGAPVEQACPQLLSLLARFPQLLMPGGCPELAPVLGLLQEFGLQPQEAVWVLAGCPKLRRLPAQRVRSVANLLRSRGFKQEDLVAVITGWPPVLAAELSRIRSVLALLQAAGLPPSKVVAYPRVFYHDPANYTAPRLAYLKAYRPQQVEQWGLANILSNADPEFVELKCKTSLEEYLLFKKRWLSLYGIKFGLGPSQAGPLQQVLRQQLAKEVTQQLFSHIDWDRV